MKSNEIELVGDDSGVALIGDSNAIDVFLTGNGLASRPLNLGRVTKNVAHVGSAVNAAGVMSAASGRWVQVSEQSAQLLKTSQLMSGSADGLKRAIATTDGGKITNILEIVQTPASLLANPVILAGVGGLMAQVAMQKAIDDIQDYLAVIDKKVDDVLRVQKNAAIADMIGVGMAIEEAMIIRTEVGHVSEVTWSKVQSGGITIARTQAYAIRELDALAEQLERHDHVDALAKSTGETARVVQEWLAVLARCFQLHDALGVLELERVLDAAPDELDRHRLGLQTASRNRLATITQTTRRILARMDEVAGLTSGEVLRNPFNSRKVVASINHVGTEIVQFHRALGVHDEREAIQAKRWLTAAVDVRDDTIAKGAEAVGVGVKISADAYGKARKGLGRFAADVSEKLLRDKASE